MFKERQNENETNEEDALHREPDH